MVSKSLIPDVFEFPSVLKSPQPNDDFECSAVLDSSDWLTFYQNERVRHPQSPGRGESKEIVKNQ